MAGHPRAGRWHRAGYDDAGASLCDPRAFTARIIKTLEGRGLIEKVPARDRRQRVVRLTAEGEAMFTEMWAVSKTKYAAIEAAFGRAEMHNLVETLNRLRAVLEEDV